MESNEFEQCSGDCETCKNDDCKELIIELSGNTQGELMIYGA